jgi:hypothetical protein
MRNWANTPTKVVINMPRFFNSHSRLRDETCIKLIIISKLVYQQKARLLKAHIPDLRQY